RGIEREAFDRRAPNHTDHHVGAVRVELGDKAARDGSDVWTAEIAGVDGTGDIGGEGGINRDRIDSLETRYADVGFTADDGRDDQRKGGVVRTDFEAHLAVRQPVAGGDVAAPGGGILPGERRGVAKRIDTKLFAFQSDARRAGEAHPDGARIGVRR